MSSLNTNTNIITPGNFSVENKNSPTVIKRSILSELTEDWWAVLIGGVIITGILLFALLSPGLKFPIPVYQWTNGDELFSNVLTVANLVLLMSIGVIFLILSAIAIRLSGGSTRNFIPGFAL